jgi:hypothetical protein
MSLKDRGAIYQWWCTGLAFVDKTGSLFLVLFYGQKLQTGFKNSMMKNIV